MRQLFYYKMRQKFTTKSVSFFIRRCDSFITKCDSYYKLRQLYYEMRQLLQNATFITNCNSTHWLLIFFIFHQTALNSNFHFSNYVLVFNLFPIFLLWTWELLIVSSFQITREIEQSDLLRTRDEGLYTYRNYLIMISTWLISEFV